MYLVFPKSLFSIADLFAVRYLWVVCNEDKCCVVTQRAADIPVAWLVYVRTYCVPIATLNQNRQTRLLYLGDVQISRRLRPCSHVYLFFKTRTSFILLFGLPPTRIQWKRSSKRHLFQRRFPERRFLKTAGLSFTCGRTKTDVFGTMMSYIIHSVPCKAFNLSSIVLAFSCRLARTIWISYVCTRIFSRTEKKCPFVKTSGY